MVAGGTYNYNGSVDTCSFLVTRAVVCIVDKNLSIYGGYNPSNWSGPNLQQNPTVIDGGGSRRGVAIVAYNTTANLTMDSFTIQNGLAQGSPTTDNFVNAGFGGGMWAQLSSVTLRNVTFLNNRSVGANNSSPAGGSGSGGALAIQSTKQGSSSLTNVTFIGNTAAGGSGSSRGGVSLGGAIFTYQATLSGTNLTFTNNSARAGSSSGSGSDGGLLADALGGAGGFSVGSNIDFRNVTATGNQAVGGNAGSNGSAGGGFGGAFETEKGSFKLTNARIQGNSVTGGVAKIGGAGMGGGLMTDDSDTTVDQTWVIANNAKAGGSSTSYQAGAPGGGGGYFVYWGSSGTRTITITNSVFADNKAEVGTPGTIIGGGGGGAVFQGVQAVVTHSTFARNQLGSGLKVGQAITVLGNGDGTASSLSSLTMRYSIISDNTWGGSSSAVTVLKNNSATFTSVLFANNTRDTNSDGRPMAAGNITLNSPIYNASVGYASPGSPNYDYHLAAGSSAIDQARGSSTTVDIDGVSRPQGAAPDVGAVEYKLTKPALAARPTSISLMTDKNNSVTLYGQIDATFGQGISWNAAASGSWLYFGTSGTNQQTSGACGTTVVFRLEPGVVNYGTYNTTVQVTSSSADPISIPVKLIKVQTLYKNFIPITRK